MVLTHNMPNTRRKNRLLACSAVSSSLGRKPRSDLARPGGVPWNLDNKKAMVNLLTSTEKQQNSVHEAIYLPILSESTVKRIYCFFGCHHDQRGCHISDYKVLLSWAVNKTILWEIHCRTYFCIFTVKTYIETKLHMPISQTGLGFSDLKLGMRLCFNIIFQRTKNFGKKKVTLASRNTLRHTKDSFLGLVVSCSPKCRFLPFQIDSLCKVCLNQH